MPAKISFLHVLQSRNFPPNFSPRYFFDIYLANFFCQIMPVKKQCNSRSREDKLTMHDVDFENWMRFAFADCFVLTGWTINGYILLLLYDRNPVLMAS